MINDHALFIGGIFRDLNGCRVFYQTGNDHSQQFLHTRFAFSVTYSSRGTRRRAYDTVNLNLGCPSGTVVAKRRGSGLLAWPHTLDAFLDEIFSSCDCRISIKTRLGTTDTDEWETLLAIYDKYPLEELIIHPRIQKDFYKYTPRMECYRT